MSGETRGLHITFGNTVSSARQWFLVVLLLALTLAPLAAWVALTTWLWSQNRELKVQLAARDSLAIASQTVRPPPTQEK
jgi:hypothetical protein